MAVFAAAFRRIVNVDAPVLRAAGDRVAPEEQHRHLSGRRIHGRDGLHRRLLDLDAIGRLRLLERTARPGSRFGSRDSSG